MKKILVGCPTSDHHKYALQEYTEAVKNLTYKNYDILLVDNSKNDSYLKKLKLLDLPTIKGPYFESARDRIIASRNILRQKVLDDNYDYLLSLEQDVLPPKNIIERLLLPKKRIISAIYFGYFEREKQGYFPLIWKKMEGSKCYMLKPEELHQGVCKVAIAGLGCILIHRTVLEKVKFRYDKNHPGFDDIHFALDCKEFGFNLYADTGLFCKHLIKNRPWNWDNLKP